MSAIMTAGIAALISAVCTIAGKLLDRRWSMQDKKEGANAEVLAAIAAVDDKLTKHIDDDDERDANQTRTRILRFNDELLEGRRHSKESFDVTLGDVDHYNEYCDGHPGYKNSVTVSATENIQRVYSDCMRDHDFL